MSNETFEVFARIDCIEELTREQAETLIKYSTRQLDSDCDEYDVRWELSDIFNGNGYIPGDMIMELAYKLGYDDETIDNYLFEDVEF